MELPAYLLTGDVRYTQVFALLLASILIASMRVSWLSAGAAVLLLVNPMSLGFAEFAWIEPLILFLFCATLFAASRYPKAVPWLLGLFLASKQTNIAILPIVPLLLNGSLAFKSVLRLAAIVLAIAALSFLPFFFWNPHAFLLSLVTVQISVPLRLDLISYPAYVVKRGWPKPPIWLPFFYLPFGAFFCWLKAPRTPSGFAWATALLMVPFFALSKQGSPNYYFIALGALCCAVALTEGDPTQSDGSANSNGSSAERAAAPVIV
jgi:voltage-gated potassium channel Kch